MPISLQRVQLPFALRDPYRDSHFDSAEYKSLWPEAPAYLSALREGSVAVLLDLSIMSTAKYEDALARGVSAAIAGEDPRSALDRVADEWDEFTETVGLDRQKAAYQVWAAKPNAYP